MGSGTRYFMCHECCSYFDEDEAIEVDDEEYCEDCLVELAKEAIEEDDEDFLEKVDDFIKKAALDKLIYDKEIDRMAELKLNKILESQDNRVHLLVVGEKEFLREHINCSSDKMMELVRVLSELKKNIRFDGTLYCCNV